MENLLIELINKYGYLGIWFLIAIENVFPPIPSEVILTFGGFMTTTSNMSIVGVVISATGGSVVGAIVLYLIGLQLDVPRLERIIDTYGHMLRLTKNDIHQANNWFTTYGPLAVFLCRFVPIIRSLISVPAGMANMNIGIFLLLTTLGTFMWNVILVYLGASVGASWDVIVTYMEIYSKTVYIILILLLLIFIFIFVKKRKR